MKSKQKGIALIVVLLGMSLVLLMILTALAGTEMSGKLVGNQLMWSGQSLQAANAGLSDTLSWFRRQTGTVAAFDPVLDPGGVCPGVGVDHTPPHNPVRNDTDDMAIGVVREYQVSAQGNVYARYESRKNPTPATGAGVIDISLLRGQTAPARIWQIESEGIVYVKNDAAVAFSVAPNRVLSRRTLRADVRRVEVTPPALAAVCTGPGAQVNIQGNGSVVGGAGTGVAYWDASPSAPAPRPPIVTGDLTGSPSQAITATSFALEDVFGVSKTELISLADYNAVTVAELPYNDLNILPSMKLILIHTNPATPNVVFDDAYPLSGSGVMVIFGNLFVNANSYSSWSGTVYVTGTVNIGAPANISGTLIALGDTVLVGSGGDRAEVTYDAAIADQVRQRVGQFRFSRAAYNPNAGS